MYNKINGFVIFVKYIRKSIIALAPCGKKITHTGVKSNCTANPDYIETLYQLAL
jgi:hypothetical protein